MMLIEFFATLWGRVALGAGLVAALVAARAADVHHQRSVGAERATAEIAKATSNAAQLGAKAAAKSLSGAPAGGVRGVRLQTDPTTRND